VLDAGKAALPFLGAHVEAGEVNSCILFNSTLDILFGAIVYHYWKILLHSNTQN